MKKKVIAVVSGGLDSISFSSLYKDQDLLLLTFDYGQKGYKELEIVKKYSKRSKIPYKLIDISFIKEIYSKSNQLTSDSVDIKESYEKSVVVPLRNALFLQVAMIYAYTHKYDEIILGSHIDDIQEINGERLYPDCSPEFFKTFELSMDLGTPREDKKVKITTPSLLGMNKSDLIKKSYPILGDFIFQTWSCYRSDEKQCGNCESCNNRKKAFDKIDIKDLTSYSNNY